MKALLLFRNLANVLRHFVASDKAPRSEQHRIMEAMRQARWGFQFARDLVRLIGVLLTGLCAAIGFNIFDDLFGAFGIVGFVMGTVAGWSCFWRTPRFVVKRSFFCPLCDKHTYTDRPWICGHCDQVNEWPSGGAFLDECKHCAREPQAFRCPHCDESLPFTLNHEPRTVAVVVRAPTMPEPPETRLARREKEKEEREHQLRMLRLDSELAEAEGHVDRLRRANKEGSDEAGDPVATDFKRHMRRMIHVHEVAATALEKAKVEFATNPEMLERIEISIEDWRMRNL